MRFLIRQQRTCDKNYPPLYWQVQQLELLHESLATNPEQGRWFDRTLIKLVFTEPDQPQPWVRRLKAGAIRKLASVVPPFDVREAAWQLKRLCQEGRLWATDHDYIHEPPDPGARALHDRS